MVWIYLRPGCTVSAVVGGERGRAGVGATKMLCGEHFRSSRDGEGEGGEG